MKQPYSIKVRIESNFDGADKPYMEAEFVQNYDTHVQQVEEQMMTFDAVVEGVKKAMMEAGVKFLEEKKTGPTRKR